MSQSFFDPPPLTKYTVLNLGAGVQSSCLALMAARGEVTPMPDFAVFADTQAEPAEVYKWLDWLETQLPFPVYRVTKGSLTDDSLKVHLKEKTQQTYLRRLIPVFGVKTNGEVTAALGRSCTADYKIAPILKFIKEKCEIKYGQKDITVTQWIGISYDEMQRAKLPGNAWTQHRWPLIEKRMRRSQCLDWMKSNGYPEPPRSACYYCPFHSKEEWNRLKKFDPVHFNLAVKFDEELREKTKEHSDGLKMEVYLHRSCKPLKDIDFDSDTDKGQQEWDFTSECEGMCGL
jgi:3'-phosphoadenosine 5'-phosphosulfate sulfotransferase (PAPS reductase)/FAD synthetase